MFSHWWDISAIVIGPVAAVAITLWYQARDRSYQSRFDVFRSLVMWRRHGTSPDFVNALNLIPVHFFKNTKVMSRRRALMDVFDDPQWLSQDLDTKARLLDRMETVRAELIREIGRAVRVGIDDLEILKGAYAPQGWRDEETLKNRAQIAALNLLEGKTALTVLPILPNTPPKIEGEQT
ncbi:DUF6680 family protein [Mesorhizobium sp. A556]